MTTHRIVALVIIALASSVNAQRTAPPSTPTPKGTNKATAEQQIDPAVAERRLTALSLLRSLADDARSYRDESLRARVQARVADALWNDDRENARALFRRAWAAAEAVETNLSGTSSPGRTSRATSPRPRTNLRAEILKLAAQRDHALGEEFLAKLTATKETEAARADDSSRRNTSPQLSPAEISERLRLASDFLESNNVERALQFADPALTQVDERTIHFLISLRDLNATAADQRFAVLLTRAATDPSADANTVSLLTSYAFTPSIFTVVSPSGIPSTMVYPPHPAPELDAGLRAGFFHVAADILLRPFSELDQSSAGRPGTYYIASRLLPLFQQNAPDLAPLISTQLAAMGPAAAQATAGDRSVNRGITPDDPDTDAIADELKDRLSHARTADERDRAYAFAAMRASDTGDPRARDFVDKIEDTDTRNGVRRFVDFNLINGMLRKKNVEEALRLARKSDLSHAQRTRALTQAAAILVKTDRAHALELLDESLVEARRIDASTAARAYALVAILAQFSQLDRARAWELTSETVKAANAVADFTGENGQVSETLEGKFSIRMGIGLAAPTDLPESFTVLAADNLYHAIDVAKGFSGEAPRALATLSVARFTLAERDRKSTH